MTDPHTHIIETLRNIRALIKKGGEEYAASLLKYGRHFPHCHEIKGRGGCTCGFAQVLEEVGANHDGQ